MRVLRWLVLGLLALGLVRGVRRRAWSGRTVASSRTRSRGDPLLADRRDLSRGVPGRLAPLTRDSLDRAPRRRAAPAPAGSSTRCTAPGSRRDGAGAGARRRLAHLHAAGLGLVRPGRARRRRGRRLRPLRPAGLPPRPRGLSHRTGGRPTPWRSPPCGSSPSTPAAASPACSSRAWPPTSPGAASARSRRSPGARPERGHPLPDPGGLPARRRLHDGARRTRARPGCGSTCAPRPSGARTSSRRRSTACWAADARSAPCTGRTPPRDVVRRSAHGRRRAPDRPPRRGGPRARVVRRTARLATGDDAYRRVTGSPTASPTSPSAPPSPSAARSDAGTDPADARLRGGPRARRDGRWPACGSAPPVDTASTRSRTTGRLAVAWSPCRPVHYVVRARNQPSWGATGTARGLRRAAQGHRPHLRLRRHDHGGDAHAQDTLPAAALRRPVGARGDQLDQAERDEDPQGHGGRRHERLLVAGRT